MTDHTSSVKAGSARTPRRWLFAVPVALFAALAVALGIGLGRDPSVLPSALLGKSAPEFDLPAVPGFGPGLSNETLKGQVSLVNVFASWCVSCLIEHPLLVELHEAGDIAVYGLNYKDAPEDAAAWLTKYGNPYDATGADSDGRVGIEWGVYGVPETFVVDSEGRIVYKYIGPVTREAWQNNILPIIQELRS